MISSDQSRAARGLLNWRQEDLAKAVGISKVSINNFERGVTKLKSETLRAIEIAFSKADIEFPDEHGVRRKTDKVQVFKGDEAVKNLWDDIFFSLKDKGGEVLITNVDEKRALDQEGAILTNHLERLEKAGIHERLLCCEGDTYFLMPRECYRWISKELFTYGTSTYIYADRVAFQIWNEAIIVLIQSRDAHDAEKRRFDDLWDRAMIPEFKEQKTGR